MQLKLPFVILTLFLLLPAACTGKGGDQPLQAAQSFFSAMHQGDYDDAWDFVSASDQARLQEELQAIASEGSADALARLNAQYGTNLSAAQVAAMDAEEFFVTLMRAATEKDAAFRRQFSELPVPQGSSTLLSEGMAEVQIRFSGGELKQYRVVREGGNWRLSWLPVQP